MMVAHLCFDAPLPLALYSSYRLLVSHTIFSITVLADLTSSEDAALVHTLLVLIVRFDNGAVASHLSKSKCLECQD